MTSPYAAIVRRWYAENARDLPWRRPEASPWSILVSEFMLQQTPVSRVLPAHAAWLDRWPEPAALAAATAADAVRQWDRLGYPRRAVRLHASASLITTRHGGQVPASAEDLRNLPGVGSYTAAAVASFAFGQRHAVLDTNVRRVLARLVAGEALPRTAPTVAEVRLAESLLPATGRAAAQWSVGVMELGALVCTAARPQLRRLPARGSVRVAAAAAASPRCWPRGRPRTRAATASAAGACWRFCARRTARCPHARLPGPGTTQRSEHVRSLRWY